MGSIGDVTRNPSVSETKSDITGLRCPNDVYCLIKIKYSNSNVGKLATADK